MGSVTGAVGSVTGAVGSVTTAVPIDWSLISNKTAAVDLTNTSIKQLDSTSPFPANFAALDISVGGAINHVVLTDTVTTYTGNTKQTGDSFALIGTAGVGLTNLGDTRIARLDTTVSSRAAAGDAMALTSGERTSVAGVVLGTTVETGLTLAQSLKLSNALAVANFTINAGTGAYAWTYNGKSRIIGIIDPVTGNRTVSSIDVT